MAEDLKNQIANLDKGYQTLTTQISKQGEEWHKEIDAVIIKMQTEIDDIKVKHRVILQKQLDKIIEIQLLIQKILNNSKVIEESNELSMVIEYKSQNRDLSKLPPKVMVSLPKLIPKQIDREMIYFFFGQITPLSTAILEIDLTQKDKITSARNHLVEPELVTIIQTDIKELSCVAFVDEDNVWTSGVTDDIKRFNIKGLILQTIKTKSGSWPNDIAVDIDGNLLYCDGCARTVNKVKNGETEELFKLPEEWTPSQMCVTSSGDFLLAMFTIDETQSKVVRYSGSKEKQSIQFDDEGKSFFSGNSSVKYITENRNHDICVTDNEACTLLVLNQHGNLRWRYTGHPSNTRQLPYHPLGITTDSRSLVLTVDGNNHCIHILDQNGMFLCYIDNCDLEYPWGLCADNNGNLFVCECDRLILKKNKIFRIDIRFPSFTSKQSV